MPKSNQKHKFLRIDHSYPVFTKTYFKSVDKTQHSDAMYLNANKRTNLVKKSI